jgi:hypothetical protein
MKKIKTIFVRDPNNLRIVLAEWQEECTWVLYGEGWATEKIDGSACLVKDGVLYKRHHLKSVKPKPSGWIHWDFDDSIEGGHGWMPVVFGQPENACHEEAWKQYDNKLQEGTYELVGPKIQRNPYGLTAHALWRHGAELLPNAPREYAGLGEWFWKNRPMEGIVWHHEDGRMAKIKRRDFGLPWPMKTSPSV